jgi:parallel beta-helix repeat protein
MLRSSQHKIGALLITTLIAFLGTTHAKTYAVGTCKPSLQSYTTISAAVASVPSGSTVDVCPGSYAEQVVISQPLTLEGVSSGNTAQAIITVPTSFAANTYSAVLQEPFAAQVLVQSPGPVNLTNLTIDGTGSNLECTSRVAGIFYASGSSGTINHATVRYQSDQGCAYGAFAENVNATDESVTIENSSIHDIDLTAIFVGSGSTPTLTVTIENNDILVNEGYYGVYTTPVQGTISGNTISNADFGIFDEGSSSLVVSSNTVTSTTNGITVNNNGTIKSNKIAYSSYGIWLNAAGATVESNTVMFAGRVGIEFNCNTGTISGNTVNDATTAFDNVPSSFSGSNDSYNVGTITTTCTAASSRQQPPSGSRVHR